ncbi:hypothetical protein BJX63DRAFT_232852 [Aspergillus granulosus]|uniref:Uncharacterized protein n=1 Tax=Aspergillus granulosus TaxID=176169 RepID=A0ABR4HCH2_9EURO
MLQSRNSVLMIFKDISKATMNVFVLPATLDRHQAQNLCCKWPCRKFAVLSSVSMIEYIVYILYLTFEVAGLKKTKDTCEQILLKPSIFCRNHWKMNKHRVMTKKCDVYP